jgi:hypothetical protein
MNIKIFCRCSCFLPGRAKDLSAPRYYNFHNDCEISGFRREVGKNCDLPGHYAACSGDSLPTFRDNLSVASPRVKNPRI